MALSDVLGSEFGSLLGSDATTPNSLPFNPPPEKAWVGEALDHVPRYLLRVTSPLSRGESTSIWERSFDGWNGDPGCHKSLFDRKDGEAAEMLNRHLRGEGGPDNLVSWTSSQLFAVQYMAYLEREMQVERDAIRLCIVDTTLFPRGIFIQDRDLMAVYQGFNWDIVKFKVLRQRRHRSFLGWYYFGEYLSQGSLRIEGKCQIVGARALVENGLLALRPDLDDPIHDQWSNAVIACRQAFYKATQPALVTPEELEAAMSLARLFDMQWRVPMAAYFLALRPRRGDDYEIINIFSRRTLVDFMSLRLGVARMAEIEDRHREACSAAKTTVVADKTLPEVQQFGVILRSIYHDFRSSLILDAVTNAESALRLDLITSITSAQDAPAEEDQAMQASGPAFGSFKVGYEQARRKFETLLLLCKQLDEVIPQV